MIEKAPAPALPGIDALREVGRAVGGKKLKATHFDGFLG